MDDTLKQFLPWLVNQAREAIKRYDKFYNDSDVERYIYRNIMSYLDIPEYKNFIHELVDHHVKFQIQYDTKLGMKTGFWEEYDLYSFITDIVISLSKIYNENSHEWERSQIRGEALLLLVNIFE